MIPVSIRDHFSTTASVLLFIVMIVMISSGSFPSKIAASFSTLSSSHNNNLSHTLPSPSSLPPIISLTPHTYDELTANKTTVFIKFFSPSCPHCQSLAPIWEKMRLELEQQQYANYENHHEYDLNNQSLVAQVDCTRDLASQQWCSREFQILGLPTLLYGDPSLGGIFLQEYNGDKDHASLLKFANSTLSAPTCSPNPDSLRYCSPATRERIAAYLKMTDAQLEREKKEVLEKELETIEQNFGREFRRMQAEYDALSFQWELQRASIRTHLKVLRAVQKQAAAMAAQ